MAIGTDKELLGSGSKFTEPQTKAGRPQINRGLVIRNLKLTDQTGKRRYTNAQIARMASCSPRTINRILKEALKSGEITKEELENKPIGVIEADFDAECIRAKGYSFADWLGTRFSNPSTARYYFNFCSKIWSEVFDSCSLVEVMDQNSQLGDKLGMKYVQTFSEDQDRMRERLKKIRFLFRFLGRNDVNDSHLTMTDTKHPRAKRSVPQITQSNFPELFTECVEECVKRLGENIRLDIYLKLCTQMRTGSAPGEREFYGITKGSETKTYLTMVSEEEYRFHIFAKRSEHWDIIWLPQKVREMLFERYMKLENGDKIASVPVQKFRDVWGDVTEKIVGRRFVLHDLRKISLTWLYVMGVPSEVAIKLNVGWMDMNTALAHYLDIKKVLRKSFRAEYREAIPDWFKEGLDDFTGFEAVIE